MTKPESKSGPKIGSTTGAEATSAADLPEESLRFEPFASNPEFRVLVSKLEFLREAETLKQVLRRNHILGGVRLENVAEHSWHLALMAVLFFEDAADPSVDLLRVLKMLLVHDLVEIDAGDTYAFDKAGHQDKVQREQKAADRIFGLLPSEHARSLRQLWDEFEEGSSPDACLALALDRVQPALQNYLHRGAIWKANRIHPRQVRDRFAPLHQSLPGLAELAEAVIDDAEAKGYFLPENERKNP